MGLLEMRSLEVNSLTSQVYSLFRDPGMHLSGLQGRIKNNSVNLLRIFDSNFFLASAGLRNGIHRRLDRMHRGLVL